MLWPFLQIFELDLLEWFQWFGNVSKLIRITLESRKIKSKREKSNREKIPFSLTYTLSQFCKSSTKATLACSLACKTPIYQLQTQMHQRNQNQIKGKINFNIHVIMVIWPFYKILPTWHPWFWLFLNQLWPTLAMTSKISSRWTSLMLTINVDSA